MQQQATTTPHSPQHFTTIIVGGGIVGAGIFRDLGIHQIKTLLIEKNDFSSQTSQSSSKMLHGGIRYLENMDFPLVWEALHEKNLWLKLAPHLCYEEEFILPVYKESQRPLWMIAIGLFLYDVLSSFRNSPFKILNVPQTLKKLPGLNDHHLKGGGLYHDAIVDDARLCLEVILDTHHRYPCATALNYTEFIDIKKSAKLYTVTTKNTLSQKLTDFTTDNIIFALGPFTDKLLHQFPQFLWQDRLLASQGSHLWIDQKKLPLKTPMVITHADGRVIFVIPQNNKVLVGTTEEIPESDYFNITPKAQEIEYLITALNENFPLYKIQADDVLSAFSGIRPLVSEGEGLNRGNTAREHKIFRPGENCYVILGGKLTTFRTMGQEITREICLKNGNAYNSNASKCDLSPATQIAPFAKRNENLKIETLKLILKNEMPKTFQDLVVRRLGISSRKHWSYSQDFDAYFKQHYDLLAKYLDINIDDITHF